VFGSVSRKTARKRLETQKRTENAAIFLKLNARFNDALYVGLQIKYMKRYIMSVAVRMQGRSACQCVRIWRRRHRRQAAMALMRFALRSRRLRQPPRLRCASSLSTDACIIIAPKRLKFRISGSARKSQKRFRDTPMFKFRAVLARTQPFLSRSVEKQGDQSWFKGRKMVNYDAIRSRALTHRIGICLSKDLLSVLSR
jgi:hypothetical protein